VILLLMLSFKALASKADSIPPYSFNPVQVDGFVCFPIYEAGAILDSLKACERLYLYTFELEQQETYYNDMILGLQMEIELHEAHVLNLKEQNKTLVDASLVLYEQKNIQYSTIEEQTNIILLQQKQIKRAKRGKNAAWAVAGGLGAALLYFVVKSI
jgi:hypothetical protein